MTTKTIWLVGAVSLAALSACGTGGARDCDPTTCALGCCDASGRCQSGQSSSACGTRGNSCRACAVTEICSTGTCMANVGGTGGGSTAGGASGGGVAGGAAGGTAGGAAGACVTDANCGTNALCHPVTRRCIPECTSSVDCPDSSKTCASFSGLPPGNAAGQKAFCQCITDALCGRAAAGFICQGATKQCEPPCTGTSCPSGLSCEPASGQCRVMGDGGTPGPCVPGGCTSQVCDPVTQRCIAPPACSLANPQPDSCAYGLVCSASACREAPRTGVGCANFTNVPTPTFWNPVGLTANAGPVTVSVTDRTDDTSFCTSTTAFSGSHVLYAAPVSLGGTNFPAAGMMLPVDLINYVRSDGQICDVQRCGGSPLFRPSGYQVSNGNKNLQLNFTLCVVGTPTTLNAGFYAERGNAVCVTMN